MEIFRALKSIESLLNIMWAVYITSNLSVCLSLSLVYMDCICYC